MQSQQPLRWAGPSVPRAKPVPPGKWEEYETELRELYDKMKLDDLMAVMKIRHNFTPSRRQYISRFEKWNVRKYQPTYGSRAVVAQSPAATNPILHGDEAIQTTHMSNTKSQHSLQSARSSQVSMGSRERPAVPPKKRQLLSEFMDSKDPYSYLGVAFDGFDAPPLENGFAMPSNVVASSSTETPGRGSIKPAGRTTRMSSLMREESSRDAPHTPGQEDKSLMSPTESAASAWEGYEPSPESTPRESTDRLAYRERRIDSTRPTESFSHDELQDMKLAADCLQSLTFYMEAFPLHVVLLKHIKHNNEAAPGMACSTLIACSRSWTLNSQFEIAQSLLKQALDETALSMNEAEKFVLRMLLADTYTRRQQYIDAKAQVKIAWLSVSSYENFIQCLPDEHRSLDLLLYHYMSRCVPSHQDLTDDNASGNYIDAEISSTMQECGFSDQILARKPGPFELEDGRFNNPCLRSCVAWCTKEIEGTVSEPGTWKKIIKDFRQQLLGEQAAVLLLGTRRTTSRRTETALTFALELYLWQRWQILKSNPTDQHDLLWAHEADNLMGIPASDLLGIVAKVIIMESTSVNVRIKPGLLSYAQFGASQLSKMSDKEVGKLFLYVFSYMRHVPPRRSDSTDGLSLLSWRGIFHLYYQDVAVREAARNLATECIEETLFLSLPEVHNEEPAPSNQSQTSLHIVCAAILPTLASSLNSSQLSSLRILRDRMQQNVRNAMQDTVMTLPSAMFRRSNTTLLSMDELSQAMASTLSLLPDAGLDVLASMSDNVMHRLGDIQRNSSNLMERLLDSEDDEPD